MAGSRLFAAKNWVMRHKKFSLVALLVVLALLARLGYLISTKGSTAPVQQPPAYVQLGEATFGNMREVGVYYGSLTAASKFSIAPKIGGEIKKLYFDIGDSILSGSVVALLDDETANLQLQQATTAVALYEAQLAEASSNLTLTRRDMERQTKLRSEKIVPASEFEAAENRLRQAEARLSVAKSQVETSRSQLEDAILRLSYTKITAVWPEGGERFIGERFADEGDLIVANKAIFSLVALDPLLVVVEVIEHDYAKMKPGQTAQLRTEAYPGEVFEGRVIRVAPVLSPTTRQARVELEVKNPDHRLRPGMFMEVSFVFNEHKDVWSVPEDVPFRLKDGFVIYVADPQTRTVRQLYSRLGLVEDGRVELLDIKDINGPVVFLGQHLLADGKQYRLPGESPRPLGEGKPGSGKNDAVKPEQPGQSGQPGQAGQGRP